MLSALDQKHLEAALGYAQLEMYRDADSELNKINIRNQSDSKILSLRVAVYRGLENWNLMMMTAEKLTAAQPQTFHWLLFHAYAASKAISVEAARGILLEAASTFPHERVILDNLALYEYRLECSTGLAPLEQGQLFGCAIGKSLACLRLFRHCFTRLCKTISAYNLRS